MKDFQIAQNFQKIIEVHSRHKLSSTRKVGRAGPLMLEVSQAAEYICKSVQRQANDHLGEQEQKNVKTDM